MEIKLTATTLGAAEIDEVVDTLRSGRVTMGAKCRAFESAFAARQGARHAVFVNSGSSANLLAWFALSNPLYRHGRSPLEPGFEVIVPAVAWSTTIWPISQAGGVPVFVDCDPRTLAIRPEAVAAAISPRSVALCPVHPLGNVCDMDALSALCTQHRLLLIEDACEALGSRFGGREAGRFGLMGTYSFYFSHHITTVEGGMIVTDDDELAGLLRMLRSHGWRRDDAPGAAVPFDDRYRFVTTGFNVRPSELNAALGIHQLTRLDAFNDRRKALNRDLTNALVSHFEAGHLRRVVASPAVDAAWFGYPVVCRTRTERDALSAHLEANGVETRPIICGNMARQPAMAHVRHRIVGSLDGADEVMDRGLYWGLHPTCGSGEIEYLSQLLRDFPWQTDAR